MFLPKTVTPHLVMEPAAFVFLCTIVTPVLLLPQQCSGHSTDLLGTLDTKRLPTIQPGISSAIFNKLPQNNAVHRDKTDNSLLEMETPEVNSDKCSEIEALRPPFQFFKNILNSNERQEILDFVPKLGPDPSSEHFTERTKNIRFIKVLDEGFEIMNKNSFAQAERYNDVFGGFQRYYELIPEHLVMGPMYNFLSFFIGQAKVSVNTLFLVTLQSSIIRPDDDVGDLSGQGVHTDGSDDAILVCVDRENVQGAETQFYADLKGTQPIGNKTILEAGDGVIFRDNKVFHDVTRATTSTVPFARRTMIIIITPCDGSGDVNPNNPHGRDDASVHLRYD